MTSAYSVFPNQGVRMRPYSVLKVTDREGNVLEENRPEPQDAIRADTAYVMTNLLRGVVQRGTAAKAAALNWPVGGKTGTTDDYTDAWFIGFDPDITIGVWVGYDQKKPIGREHDRRRSRAADLDGHHEGLDRRPQGAAEVRAARQHRLRVGRQQRRLHRRRDTGAIRKPSSRGRSRAGCDELIQRCSLSRCLRCPRPLRGGPPSAGTTTRRNDAVTWPGVIRSSVCLSYGGDCTQYQRPPRWRERRILSK